MESPLLATTSAANNVGLTWPEAGMGNLEAATNLGLLNSWFAVNRTAITNAGQISVTVPATNSAAFFSSGESVVKARLSPSSGQTGGPVLDTGRMSC